MKQIPLLDPAIKDFGKFKASSYLLRNEGAQYQPQAQDWPQTNFNSPDLCEMIKRVELESTGNDFDLISKIAFENVTANDVKTLGATTTAKLINFLQRIIREHGFAKNEVGHPEPASKEQKVSPRFCREHTVPPQKPVVYECVLCKDKKFINQKYLDAHYARRHPEYNTELASEKPSQNSPVAEMKELLSAVAPQIHLGSPPESTFPLRMEKVVPAGENADSEHGYPQLLSLKPPSVKRSEFGTAATTFPNSNIVSTL